MDSSSKSDESIKQRKMVVKDPKGIAISFFALFSLLIATIFTAPGIGDLFISIIFFLCLLLCIFCIFHIRAALKGYEIDLENDTFSYPGGKVADEFLDYFKISWLLQFIGVKRGMIRCSEITHISKEDSVTEYWDKQKGRYVTNTSYNINFQGTFGSIQNSFESSGKRDQLYSLLGQVLEMGEPVVVR